MRALYQSISAAFQELMSATHAEATGTHNPQCSNATLQHNYMTTQTRNDEDVGLYMNVHVWFAVSGSNTSRFSFVSS